MAVLKRSLRISANWYPSWITSGRKYEGGFRHAQSEGLSILRRFDAEPFVDAPSVTVRLFKEKRWAFQIPNESQARLLHVPERADIGYLGVSAKYSITCLNLKAWAGEFPQASFRCEPARVEIPGRSDKDIRARPETCARCRWGHCSICAGTHGGVGRRWCAAGC